jgi:hypothetical protein
MTHVPLHLLQVHGRVGASCFGPHFYGFRWIRFCRWYSELCKFKDQHTRKIHEGKSGISYAPCVNMSCTSTSTT